MYGKGRELEIGNATSAILISLLRALVDKQVLSNTEARAVLTKAADKLGPHDYTAPVKGGSASSSMTFCNSFPRTGATNRSGQSTHDSHPKRRRCSARDRRLDR
jgi:hypothetical protein